MRLDDCTRNGVRTPRMKLGVTQLTATYAAVAGAWILVSDILLFDYLPAFFDTQLGSVAKGLAFVLVTSALLHVLALRLTRTERDLQFASVASDLDFLRLPEFFTALPVVVYVLENREGSMIPVWVSENIEQILGYPREDAMAREWWFDHLFPEEAENVAGENAAIVAGGGGAHAYRVRHRDGHYLYIKDQLKRLSTGADGTERWLGVWTNIDHQQQSEEQLRQYASRLETAMTSTVETIALLTEMRDPYTAGHEQRVGLIAAAIAREMNLDGNFQKGVKIAGILHDIGKIAIPTEILIKPSKLTASEFNLIKEHPGHGREILKHIDFPWPVADTAHQHHERMDGSGYPQGLKGTDICLEARIVAVADVIESMASHRPYRPGLGLDAGLAEIARGAGSLYDREVADACLRLFREKGYSLPV